MGRDCKNDIDASSGHQNYFRDYDPAVGSYVESDPIGLGGGSFSTYGYAGAAPITSADASGLNSHTSPSPGYAIPWPMNSCYWPGSPANNAWAANAANQIGDAIDSAIGAIVNMCRSKPNCQEHFTKCLMTSLADKPGSVFGSSRCLQCRDACVREGGQWPDIAMSGGKSVRCDYWNYK